MEDSTEMSGAECRAYWVSVLDRIARPVLEALAERELRARMPVEARSGVADRAEYTHFEAVARTLVGIAPWLELPPDDTSEGALRATYRGLVAAGLRAALTPASPDYLNFHRGQQPLVEMGFLGQSVLRAPNVLNADMDARTRADLIAALRAGRDRRPSYSNWLLFAATAEVALRALGADWDPMRVDYALRQHEAWYKGDGVYGDGPAFHWDYYNSFVIQPMLVEIVRELGDAKGWESFREPVLSRARRWAAVQERLISPEGTYPPLGRSLAYRFGAFQSLAQAALLGLLPDEVTPGAVREALTAVIRRQVEAPGTFDAGGWLRIGFCGAQPGIGEGYISTGSLYLCTAVLLPLGLPADAPFWSEPAADWTAKRLWSGRDGPIDHAL